VKTITIPELTNDAAVNIALDTISKGKQALYFVSSKRNAESLAERIANKYKITPRKDDDPLLKKILHLPKPTKQCQRLALITKKNIAFHHAGLTSQQKELIQEQFKEGTIKIICATPTLAAGVDLPAFRSVIRDTLRFGMRGMMPIPVLEYEQMSGRAGRPGKDDYGEALLIASTEENAEKLRDTYINGDPEEIQSKLAVEPILRTYCLSLIATEFVDSKQALEKFFSKTFYAHQYGDVKKLNKLLDKTLHQLADWGFINTEKDDFVSADALLSRKNAALFATRIGKRVSQLYIDPYTAHFLISNINVTKTKKPKPFSYLHVVCSCLEMRPLLRAKVKEQAILQEKIALHEDEFLLSEPNYYDDQYGEFIDACKTTLFFNDWIHEIHEDQLMNDYDIRPGEIKAKLDVADWLLFGAEELARLQKNLGVITDIKKLRVRLKHGAKEELLPLLRLRNIGRVRARMLFRNNVKDVAALKSVDIATLNHLLGNKLAINIKKQVGITIDAPSVKKRKGQMNIKKY